MKNLKKVLSLVLALAMALSLMTVAFAKDASDYTDYGTITNKEAVDVLTALEVIDGMGNNTFQPTGNVTRAQMAKMITIICLGNVDPTAFLGTQTDLKDINGHWAEAYIKYCYSQGIISGRGNGVFDPNANVTSAEASKMLLTAIGYNAKVQGYTGPQWAINVTRDAQLKGFYKDVSVPSNKALTRDEAAQMIWNAVQAQTVRQSKSLNTETGVVTISYVDETYTVAGGGVRAESLLHKTFGAVTQVAYMTGVSYDSVKGQYGYTFDIDGDVFTTYATPDISAEPDALTAARQTGLKSATDYSALFGQKVSIVYKDDASESYPVYGIYSEADVIVEGTIGDIADADGAATIAAADKSIKVGDTKYNLSDEAQHISVYDFNDTTGTDNNNDGISDKEATVLSTPGLVNGTVKDYQKFAAIDNNDDGKIDMLVVYPVAVAKVTYVGTASVTIGGVSMAYDKDNNYYTVTAGNNNIPNGNYDLPKLAKGDFVAVTSDVVTDKNGSAAVLETVQGKVTALDSANGKVQVDGTWYPYLTADPTINSTYKFQICNGYLVDAELIDSASKDILYVIKGDNGSNLSNMKLQVMFTDGRIEVIEVKKVDGNATTTAPTGANVEVLYTYTKNSDGTYDIKKVSDANLAGYDDFDTVAKNDTPNNYEYTAATSTDYAKLGGKAIADDAVVFVKSGTGSDAKYSVISGATLKTYKDTDTNANVDMLLGASNGQSSVKVATMSVGAAFGLTSTYAYITSDPYKTVEDNVEYANYTAWTANGSITVKDETTSVAKGDIVNLTANSDGSYKSASITSNLGGAEDTLAMLPVAITGYNGTDSTITLAKQDGSLIADAKLFDSKTQFIYVNTKDKTGLEGGEIALAEKQDNGSYIMNAYAIFTVNGSNGLKEIKAIVFDVNNDLDNQGAAGYTINWTGGVPAITTPWDSTGSGAAIDSIKWTVGGVEVTASGNYYAVEGEKIVATVTMSTDALTVNSTCTLVGGTGATAAIKTAPTFATTGGTAADDAAASATTTTVTLTKDTGATTTTATGGVFTFTWVAGGSNTYTVTGTNS